MNKQSKYKESDKLSDLICENYALLLVMSRFGLSLGFGEKNVREVCEQNGVDVNTFLAVANFLEEELYLTGDEFENISVGSLINYLKSAHVYFLEFCFPSMRRKLIEAIDCAEKDISFLILKFYDDYVGEVRKHMEYEDKVVFRYVSSLLQGEHPGNYSISVFIRKHNQIDTKLTDLKNIIIKYYPAHVNNNLLNSVLFDIYSCEKDLRAHNKVEDYMFVPMITELEKKSS